MECLYHGVLYKWVWAYCLLVAHVVLITTVIGLSFLIWTFQIYAEQTQVVTNIVLVGIGTLLLGAVLLISAILLYSLVSVVQDKRNT